MALMVLVYLIQHQMARWTLNLSTPFPMIGLNARQRALSANGLIYPKPFFQMPTKTIGCCNPSCLVKQFLTPRKFRHSSESPSNHFAALPTRTTKMLSRACSRKPRPHFRQIRKAWQPPAPPPCSYRLTKVEDNLTQCRHCQRKKCFLAATFRKPLPMPSLNGEPLRQVLKKMESITRTAL